jgi:hypothetical protein
MYEFEIAMVGNPFKQLRDVSAHNMQMAKELADLARARYEAIRSAR